MTTVHVVMAVFNRVEQTLSCLEDLGRQRDVRLDIILVDGGSTDGTPQTVSKTHPGVEIIAPGRPLWWTEAMVIGIDRAREKAADGDYVLSMNNDVEIDEPDYVTRLIALSEKSGRALAGSFCWKDRTRKTFETCGGWARWTKGLLVHTDMVPLPNDPIELDFLVGRGLLIPLETFAQIGSFDEKSFPQYWSDTDFTLRARKAGLRLVASRTVAIRHAEPTRAMQRTSFFMSHREAWRRLTGVNSHLSLPQGFRFLRRHCPAARYPMAVVTMTMRALFFTVLQTFPFALVFRPASWMIDRVWRRGEISRTASTSASRG